MTLLAVSSHGELAVLLDAHYVWYRLFTGTLARMTLSGGAPREIQEGVRQADWSPDGSQLAIIREVGGKDRLEYPIGHVLREVSGSLSDVRFSPNGDRIAFFEHPRKLDDRGSVNTVDVSGNNTVLSDGYWSLRGLSWAPDGKEILYSASQSGGSYAVYGVTMAGKRRRAYQPPGGFVIQDVARLSYPLQGTTKRSSRVGNYKVLFEIEQSELVVAAIGPPQQVYRDVWMTFQFLLAMTCEFVGRHFSWAKLTVLG